MLTDLDHTIAELDAFALKAANFGAKKGQVIVGKLVRGGDGKFASGGSSSQSDRIASSVTDSSKIATIKGGGAKFSLPKTPKGKAGGKGKAAPKGKAGAKVKKTPEQVKADQAKNLGDVVEKTLGSDMAEVMTVGKFPGDLSGVNPEYGDKLVKSGLANKNADGSYVLNGAGNSLVKAAQKGDVAGAQKIIAGAGGKAVNANAKADAKTSAKTQKVADHLAKTNVALARHAALQKQSADKKAAVESKRQAAASDRANKKSAQLDLKQSQLNEKKASGGKLSGNQQLSQQQQKIDLQRKLKEAGGTVEMGSPSMVTVLKDKNDRWRWVALTSSSFEDQDGETITLKALQEDCDRCDATGEYGPLRLWHMPGVDIGDCDFNALHGRIEIESGTFRNEAFGDILSQTKELAISRGYKYPRGMFQGRVYNQVHKFERSVLPADKASNLLTAFGTFNTTSKENKSMPPMPVEKKNFFQRLFDGNPAAAVALDTILENAEKAEKEAEKQGLAFKAKADPSAMPPADPNDPPATSDPSADPPEGSPEEEAAETPEEEAAEGDDDSPTAQMMQQLHDRLDATIAAKMQEALQPLMDLLQSKDETATKESGVLAVALKETALALKEVSGVQDAAMGRITALETSLKELTAIQPRAYRASQAADTILKEDSALKSVAPKSSPLDDMLAGLGLKFDQPQS